MATSSVASDSSLIEANSSEVTGSSLTVTTSSEVTGSSLTVTPSPEVSGSSLTVATSSVVTGSSLIEANSSVFFGSKLVEAISPESISETVAFSIAGILFSTVSIVIKNTANNAKAAAKERITLSSELLPNFFFTLKDFSNLRISVFFALIFVCPLGGTY